MQIDLEGVAVMLSRRLKVPRDWVATVVDLIATRQEDGSWKRSDMQEREIRRDVPVSSTTWRDAPSGKIPIADARRIHRALMRVVG